MFLQSIISQPLIEAVTFKAFSKFSVRRDFQGMSAPLSRRARSIRMDQKRERRTPGRDHPVDGFVSDIGSSTPDVCALLLPSGHPSKLGPR
jgi:hypothetical protein